MSQELTELSAQQLARGMWDWVARTSRSNSGLYIVAGAASDYEQAKSHYDEVLRRLQKLEDWERKVRLAGGE